MTPGTGLVARWDMAVPLSARVAVGAVVRRTRRGVIPAVPASGSGGAQVPVVLWVLLSMFVVSVVATAADGLLQRLRWWLYQRWLSAELAAEARDRETWRRSQCRRQELGDPPPGDAGDPDVH